MACRADVADRRLQPGAFPRPAGPTGTMCQNFLLAFLGQGCQGFAELRQDDRIWKSSFQYRYPVAEIIEIDKNSAEPCDVDHDFDFDGTQVFAFAGKKPKCGCPANWQKSSSKRTI